MVRLYSLELIYSSCVWKYNKDKTVVIHARSSVKCIYFWSETFSFNTLPVGKEKYDNKKQDNQKKEDELYKASCGLKKESISVQIHLWTSGIDPNCWGEKCLISQTIPYKSNIQYTYRHMALHSLTVNKQLDWVRQSLIYFIFGDAVVDAWFVWIHCEVLDVRHYYTPFRVLCLLVPWIMFDWGIAVTAAAQFHRTLPVRLLLLCCSRDVCVFRSIWAGKFRRKGSRTKWYTQYTVFKDRTGLTAEIKDTSKWLWVEFEN